MGDTYEQELHNAVRDGIREGIKNKLTQGYNNPIDKLLSSVIEKHSSDFNSLLSDAIKSCVNNEEFREDIKTQTRKNLAKVLVARFGGELEKRVNDLKADPTTRARIITAIDDIVRERVNPA